MVGKMLTKGAVYYLRGIIVAVAMAAANPSGAAAIIYAPSLDTSFQNSGPSLHEFVSLSVSEYKLQSATDLLLVATGEPGASGMVYSPASFNDNGKDDTTELDGVVRHRGFIKILLIVFVCGAIVRFLTSPTFLNFITDALDPKAW